MKLKKLIIPCILLCAATTMKAALFEINVNQAIPDNSIAGMASKQVVSGQSGYVSDLVVSLNISGSGNGDIYAWLTHGSGFAILLNRAGRTSLNEWGYADGGFDIKLSDAATVDIHNYGGNGGNGGNLLTGTFQPDGRNVLPNVVLDTTSRKAMLSSFNGVSPNGEWDLYVADTSGGDVHQLQSWSVGFNTTPTPVPEPECLGWVAVAILLGAIGMRNAMWRLRGTVSKWMLLVCVIAVSQFANGSFLPKANASQTPGIIENTFGGAEDDWASGIVCTSDGGFAIAGTTSSFGTGSQDYYLVKLDANGQKQWDHTYGGADYDIVAAGNCLVMTSDGGFVIFGTSRSFGSSRGMFYLVRTDASGQKLWEKTYGHWDMTVGDAIRATDDGGFILAGHSTQTDAWLDYRVTKVDANGNEQWTQFYGASGGDDDTPNDIIVTPDKGYLIAGRSGYWSRDTQAWMIRTDDKGNKLWDVAWGDAGRDIANGVTATQDGGFICVGSTASHGAGDAFMLKLNASGQTQWSQTYGGAGSDTATRVIRRSNGNFLFCGATNVSSGNTDLWVVETSPSGQRVNQWTFGKSGNSSAANIIETSSGFAIVGTVATQANKQDIYFAMVGVALNPVAAIVPTQYAMQISLGQQGQIAAGKLIRAASAPAGTSLTLSLASLASDLGGQLQFSDGMITYTPPASLLGTDTFTYTLTDGHGLSAQGTVTVTITAPTGSGPNVLGITPGASVTVRMAGFPGLIYQIEASTDLIHWVNIGQATAGPNGLFEFVDHDSSRYPIRYYRTGQ